MKRPSCLVIICAIGLLAILLAAGAGYLRALEDLLRAGDWMSAGILVAVLLLVGVVART